MAFVLRVLAPYDRIPMNQCARNNFSIREFLAATNTFLAPGKKKLGMVHFTIKVADSMGGKTPIDWEEDDLQAGPADAAIKIGP